MTASRSGSTRPASITMRARSIRAWSERSSFSSLMKRITRAALILASTLAALALGAGAFVGSGIYDIGADDHHTRIVLALIERLRDRSIEVRARNIEVPELQSGARIAAGARSYAALCVSCHLAPGTTKSALRPGLYPHPPNLAQAREAVGLAG